MSGYGVAETPSKVVLEDYPSSKTTLSVNQFKSEQLSIQGDKYYYGVQVVTGKQLGAGSKSQQLYVTLVGSKRHTGKIILQNFWDAIFDPITKESTENLTLESDEDLGDVLVVIAGSNDKELDDNWYVSSVGVVNFQTNSEDYFPCYHWIGGEDYVSFTANTTTLKDVGSNKVLQNQRSEQLKQRRDMYKWQKFPDGLPSGIDDSGKLPPDEQFGIVKNFDFTAAALASVAGIAITGVGVTVDELRDYEVLADALGGERPLYQAGRWTTDVEFGRQMLNGINPIIVERCSTLLTNFPVTNDMVKPFLVRGLSLEEEMKAGHVYICDLKIMDGLQPREGNFSVAPICLLYVNGAGQLVPIAIQLKQGVKEEEKVNNPIFLPNDNWIDWLLAKIYYKSAHGQLHQLFTHYTSCHATMEAFAMATQRNLPDPHPIFKLLRPHFRYTMAINFRARATLINKGGVIDQFFGIGGAGKEELFKRCGKHYNIYTSHVKEYARKRGVDNAEQLPGYFYRDDGFRVWDALEVYAGSIINEFYQSDSDVKGDEELQKWAQDAHINAFPGSAEIPNGHGFPESISSREQLRDLCTLIMFTGSAQHASVNFEQYYYYRFVPNSPLSIRRPPPAKKGVSDYQTLLNSLPNKITSLGNIGITYLLSQYSQNEEFLGSLKERFREKSVIHIVNELKDSLNRISGELIVRNESLDMPYPGMIPEKIPNSITI